MLWNADGVIAISKQIQDYYLTNFQLKQEKVHLIINGVDTDIYKKKDNKQLRMELGISNQEKVVGMVANIRPEKNHKLLISAFSNVTKIMKNVRLLLVGDDCMDGDINRFAARYSSNPNKIQFLGSRNDIADLLNVFEYVLSSFKYEGLPITILEAMATSIPVIGADVLGINEIIIDNVNGLLFPANDINILTKKLILLLENGSLRDRLSSAGKDSVLKYYSLDEQIKQYDKLFLYITTI